MTKNLNKVINNFVQTKTQLLFFIQIALVLSLLSCVVSCVRNKAELGTAENPVKIQFVPSIDAKVIEDNSKKFKDYLEKHTPYKFDVTIPQSYIAVVEAFGTKRADVAAMNTFGYLIAHKKYGVEARLTALRHDLATYQSMFVARANGPIKKIEDLNGKKIAFVDPASTTGFIIASKTLKDKKVTPKETMFAQRHDNVISMVYQGQVDAGAAYYSPPAKNENGVEQIEDARRLVLTQYPDVKNKVVIINLSEPVPNDPFVFRKDMSEEMKTKIIEAMLSFVSTKEGRDSFFAIYGATGLKKAIDKDYDVVRDMLDSIGQKPEDFLRK